MSQQVPNPSAYRAGNLGEQSCRCEWESKWQLTLSVRETRGPGADCGDLGKKVCLSKGAATPQKHGPRLPDILDF